MDSVSTDWTSFVMLNSALIDVRAGDIIDEDTGDSKVNDETMNVAAHFRFIDQFLGFFGSSGPSHDTCLLSAHR